MQTDSKYLTEIFSSMSKIGNSDYNWLYQSDHLVAKIIDTFPTEAYGTGFKITSDDSSIYELALNSLGVWELFKRASIWARLNGLCCALMGSAGQLDTPITGTVEFLKLYSLPNNTDITEDVITVGQTKVHKSRLLFFKGVEVLKDFGEIKVHYTSVLDGVINTLEQFQRITDISITLLRTSNQVSLGTAGLGAGIRNDLLTGTNTQRNAIQSRLNTVNMGRDVANILLYDRDNEQISNTALSLSGVKDLVEVLENQLSLRTDYPKSVLFGDSRSSNLGTGTVSQLVERMVWADKLAKWIDANWTENIETLCGLIQMDLGLSDFSVSVPLSLILSPLEVAEINEKQAHILDVIEKYYPMDNVGEYIKNNFSSIFLPEQQKTTVPSVTTDSMDILEQFAAVNSQTMDTVMRKIGENSAAK